MSEGTRRAEIEERVSGVEALIDHPPSRNLSDLRWLLDRLAEVEWERDEYRRSEEYAIREANRQLARAEKAEAALARVRAQLPDECWVSRTTEVRCTDYVGGTFTDGATFTEDMCCLSCRLRAALDGEQP